MLYPMFALMLLTLVVAAYLLAMRVNAVRTRKVSMGYFRVYTGAEPPARLTAAANHYSNLFEVPVLFYLACITALVLDAETGSLITLGWAYVALRLVHTAIHLSYNNVVHRLTAFLASNLVLIVIWVLLAGHYGTGT